MLSLPHEAPLGVLRRDPALVPALLREVLHLDVPPHVAANLDDPDATQPVPAPFRADLAVTLRGGAPDDRPVMGILVEIQRWRDDDKRRSWPLYAATLHARLECQTCLVVIATDDKVARWAAEPIHTLQPRSPFTPLVIRPDQIPRLSLARARREPWLAVLSALVHCNRSGGTSVTVAALQAVDGLPDEHAMFCSDLIHASLNDAARRALEKEMQTGKYEFQSDFARRYFGEGQKKGEKQGQLRATRSLLLGLVERRFGPVTEQLRRPIKACADLARLTALVYEIGVAPDRQTAQRLVAALEAAPTRATRAHTRAPRSRRAHAKRAPRARTSRR